jgi:hypothetical protein
MAASDLGAGVTTEVVTANLPPHGGGRASPTVPRATLDGAVSGQ